MLAFSLFLEDVMVSLEVNGDVFFLFLGPKSVGKKEYYGVFILLNVK